MELIAEKPLYRGRGRELIQPGSVFTETIPAYANDLIRSGKARPNFHETKPHWPTLGPGSVSCIMPTKNRRQFVPRAIACFQAQSYGPRELIILDNGDSVKDLVPDDRRIRYTLLKSKQSTGQFRNFCCQMAQGEFIAHWDDDDWYHPERLAEQIALIGEHQAAGYHSILFDGPKGVYSYNGQPDYALGTSLLYRRSWWLSNKFPSVNVGEDSEYVERLGRRLIVADGKARIVASIHASNTSPRYPELKDAKGHSAWKREDRCILPVGYS